MDLLRNPAAWVIAAVPLFAPSVLTLVVSGGTLAYAWWTDR